jgi:hypothetical protein
MIVFRASMGDFSIIASSLYLEQYWNRIFWVIFFLILFSTNIIFLNFVIAEASNSYNEISEKLDQYNLMEKSKLIDEAEHMLPVKYRNPLWYPKYIVVRE